MKQRYISVAISVVLLVIGVLLVVYTSVLTGWRSPKAEMAGYLFSAVGLIATCITAVRAFLYVLPVPGCIVYFWGPDGRTKLAGRITRVEGDKFGVETTAGTFTLKEANFLSVERAKG